MSTSTSHKPIMTESNPLGYWRDLQSGRNFVGQSLKNCMDIVHVDIVDIWNLDDEASVSFLRFPCCF